MSLIDRQSLIAYSFAAAFVATCGIGTSLVTRQAYGRVDAAAPELSKETKARIANLPASGMLLNVSERDLTAWKIEITPSTTAALKALGLDIK